MRSLEMRRPFTYAEAVTAGITPKRLRGRGFRRIFHGVYIDARVPDHPLIRCEAALRLHAPKAFASHFSAGRIYALPLPPHSLEHVSVRDRSNRSQRDGIRCHVAAPPEEDVRLFAGIRVSSPLRVFLELASVLTLVDLVVVGDALVRLKLTTVPELVDYCARSSDRHAASARRASGFVRADVDSAMETRLRMLIVLAGLPEPVVNHEVRDDYGHLLMRFDLSYPDLGLIVEYDGRQHAERAKQWHRDVKRREALDDERWRILIVTSEGIYQKPAETVQRVHGALVERGHGGLPVRLSPAWRPFFPSR